MFFLDKNVLEIAKLSAKPLGAEGNVMNSVIWFTPDGRLFYTNSYYLVEYKLPTVDDIEKEEAQLALFEKTEEFKRSCLTKAVGILGKEFVHTCDFKSEMPDVGEYAIIREDFIASEPTADVFWTSGVSEKVTKHLIQSNVEMPDFDALINRMFEPNGSRLMVDSEYMKQLTALMHKVVKSRDLNEEYTMNIDKTRNRMIMSCECLKITIMAKKDHE